MKIQLKKLYYYLKHFICGNYCEKCERCKYFWKDPYNGLDTCDFKFTHSWSPRIIRGDFNQIIDCDDFEEKNQVGFWKR